MKYKKGDIVFVKVDVERTPYMITGVLSRFGYKLFEITSNENIIFKHAKELIPETGATKVAGFKQDKK